MSPEAAAIRDCLCLRRTLDASTAEMNAKMAEMEQLRAELARLEGELRRARQEVDVNDPKAVAGFKQLLERRDAVSRRVNGPLVAELRAAIDRNGGIVNDYNARCANRPFNSELVAQVQATLTCPAP